MLHEHTIKFSALHRYECKISRSIILIINYLINRLIDYNRLIVAALTAGVFCVRHTDGNQKRSEM